jgi:predicted phage terminase large subunit-like protein
MQLPKEQLTALLKRRESIARELLQRELSKDSLLEFVKYTKPDFEAAKHLLKIIAALEAVERGELKRLMIFAPPRHGKSELSTRRFPSWYLGRNPNHQIISISYNDEFATDFGRDVRNIVASTEYQNVFNTRLRSDSKAANRWHTNENGIYVSAGVGGGITGKGAHVLLIDDPIKNREEADSETMRNKIWKEYTSSMITRLMSKGAIIITLTRWHEDDLAGRLLAKQPGKWHVINLPAENEDGSALWPERFPLDYLHEIKGLNVRDYNALYLGKPTTEEGTFYRREWFKRFDLLDMPVVNKYGVSDYATKQDAGDYTEHGIFGVNEKKDIYISDWWFGQTTADVWIETQLDLVKKHKPFAWFGESGPIRRAVEPFLNKRMQDRSDYCRQEWITKTHDKTISARAFQALAASGKVWIVNGPVGDRLIEQLVKFPTGTHDDGPDVCATFGMAIESAHPAIYWDVQTNKPRDPYDNLFDKIETENSWRTK